MHTTITTTEPTIADLQRVMIRIQIAALETMERCMQDTESSGNEKKDRAESTKLNRQRMAAAQTLTHCRTMFRELREAEAQQHRIAEEKKQSARKAIFDLASLRRLHKTYPGEYDNPDAPASTPAPSPLEGEGGDRSQIDRRMRGRPEPSDDQGAVGATGGSPASAGPPQPDLHSENEKDPLKGAVVGAEGAGHADNASPNTASPGLDPAPTAPRPPASRLEELLLIRDEQRARRRAEALAAEQNASR